MGTINMNFISSLSVNFESRIFIYKIHHVNSLLLYSSFIYLIVNLKLTFDLEFMVLSKHCLG